MHKDRFAWCLAVIGWTSEGLAWRIHTASRNIRRMRAGYTYIPDELNLWLEQLATRTLVDRPMPANWRPPAPPDPEVSHETRE